MITVPTSLARSLALLALAAYPLSAAAQDKPAPPGEAQGFAYAAPAFIKTPSRAGPPW